MAGSLLAYPEDIEITHCIPSESVTETMDIGTILPTSITARLLHDLIGDIWDLEDPEAQQVVMVSGSPAFQAANFKLLTKIGIECENILLLPQTPIDFNYGTAGLGKSSTKLNQETNDQVMISQPSLKVDIVVDPFEDENELSLSPIGFTRTKAIKRSSRYFDEIPSATVTATLDPNDTYIEGGSLVCSPIETGKTIKRKATPDVTSDQRDVDIPQQIIPHIPDGPAVVESRSIQDKPSLIEDGLGDLTNEMGHTPSKPSFMEDDLGDLMNEMGHTASKPSFMEDDLDDLMNEMGIQPTVRAPFPALSTFTEPPRFGLTMFKRGAGNIQSSEPPESPKTEVKVEPEPIESKAMPIDELAEFLQWKEQD
ncbi:hypothetical protein HDV02_000349 [Globomyces sp. JEL0801]|nr:hypothetical protein HDV02_000349 [Globomyces sp. JEL0801]